MNSNHRLLLGVAGVIITMILAVRLTPPPMPDPLVQALTLCGDTPKPVEYRRLDQGRFGITVPIEPEARPYAAAVKSVDDCRANVLEHFGKNAKNS